MRRIFLIIAILLWGSCLCRAEISVLKFVKTPKEKVCFGDIAKGVDPKWKDIVLVHITTPDSSVELPAGYIRARLRLKGVPVDKLNIKIPDVVKVKREGIRISRKDLEAIARHCIKRNNPWGRDLKIVEIKATKEVLLPKGKISYWCQLNGSPVGNFSVPIIFKLNGEIVSRTWVMAKTRLVIPVVVAKYPIKRGEIITSEKLKIVKKDISALPKGMFVKKEEVIGKKAKTNISVGRIIYKAMVEVPPVIKRGQRVMIVAESDTLKVTAPGMAKQDGRVGEVIKVENLLSKKIVSGTVVDSQTVRVKF